MGLLVFNYFNWESNYCIDACLLGDFLLCTSKKNSMPNYFKHGLKSCAVVFEIKVIT